MQIVQLNELINIIDTLIEDEDEDSDIDSINDFLLDEFSILEFTETSLLLMEEYLMDNPTFITEPTFEEDFKENIMELICIPFEQDFFWNPNLKEDINNIFNCIVDIFFTLFMPNRSFSSSIILTNPDYNRIENQINNLRLKPQPDQRTEEWYKFRNNLITASNAYKAFENENVRNQLIYEKCNLCKPETNAFSSINVNTTLHWGQKYEKVSVMI